MTKLTTLLLSVSLLCSRGRAALRDRLFFRGVWDALVLAQADELVDPLHTYQNLEKRVGKVRNED